MPRQWTFTNLGGAWLAPAFLGVLFVCFGVLVIYYPKLLELIIASVFIFAGGSFIACAWRLRGRVTYRPIDDDSSPPHGPEVF